MKNLLKSVLIIFLVIISTKVSATVYYVKASTGNDANSGLSSAQAWKTLAKVNTITFKAGDEIWFRSGESWTGMLWPKGSGTASNPIIITSYGSGSAPLIRGNGSVNCTSESGKTNYCALYLYNQQYWLIEKLEITNYKASEEGGNSIGQWENSNISNYANQNKPTKYSGTNTRKTGVLIEARNKGKISGITLKNLEVHAVNGDISDKDNGGIFINIFKNSSSDMTTWFDDFLIEDCYIHDVDRTGISNASVYDNRTFNTNDDWKPSTNFIVRDNVFERSGANALIIRVADDPLIENNLFDHCSIKESGNAAFVFNTDGAVIQNNEARFTKYNVGDNDAGGIDSDFRTKNTLIQYNYVHDNDFGTLITGGKGSGTGFNNNTVFRYNLLINDGILEEPGYGAWAFKISGKATNTKVYNNVIYIGSSKSYTDIVFHKTLAGGTPANSVYTNNIFYNVGSNTSFNLGTSLGNSFNSNIFHGNNMSNEPNDPNKITQNPGFSNPGGGKFGYRITEASPAAKAGIRLATTPSKDFYGNTIASTAAIDIGANQVSTTSVGQSSNVSVSEDSHIRGGSNADNNYGSEQFLVIKGSSNSSFERQALLKFNIGEYSSVSSAKLRVYGSAQSSVTLDVYELDNDSWGESSVTWNNAPAFAGGVGNFNVGSSTQWYEIDVTSAVQSEVQSGFSIISFGIRDNSKSVINVDLYSEQNSQNTFSPRLIINGETTNSSRILSNLEASEVDNVLKINGLSFFPNPVKSTLYVHTENKLSSVAIFDLSGHLIDSFPLHDQAKAQISLLNYAAGLYYVQVIDKKGFSSVQRIVKE